MPLPDVKCHSLACHLFRVERGDGLFCNMVPVEMVLDLDKTLDTSLPPTDASPIGGLDTLNASAVCENYVAVPLRI